MSAKTAVYLRQSLDRDQTKLAVARQRADCLKLCEQRGWEPVEYCDNSVSATNGKMRPAYLRMLADIADDKIDAVVTWDADRLTRVPRELEDFIDLADKHKIALATVGGDFDLSTPTGRGNARMKGVFARMEMEQKSERQRRAALQKAQRGLPHWKQAFGYLQGVDGPELDPLTAPLVKQAYAALLAGSSLGDICRIFNNAQAYGLNGKPWRQSTLGMFLRKPRNAGLRSYKGEIVGKGNWPALVAEQTWKAAQTVLDAPGRAPGRKSVRQHKLTGVLTCGKCGGHLSGAWAMQKTGVHSIVYACKTCRGVSIRAEHVEPLLYDIVGGRLAMSDAIDLLKAEIHDEREAEAIRLELETLYANLDRYAIEYADGLLTARQVKISTDRDIEKIAKLERKQQDQERLRVFEDIPLGKPQAVDAVQRLSADRFRAVIDVLAATTVAPVGKGGHVFNPERVQVDWKS